MKDQVVEYIRILKKSGFQAAKFDYDYDKYLENEKLLQQLKVEQQGLNLKVLQTSFYNF